MRDGQSEINRECERQVAERPDVRQLLPRHKSDDARARAAIQVGYPAVEPILGELLTWLQDYNWPVAHTLAPFLAGIGPVPALVAEVRQVLASTDTAWNYWVLTILVDAWPDDALPALIPELQRIALATTPEEVAWELPDVANDLLARAGRGRI